MSDEEMVFEIRISRERGYQFKVDFELENVPSLIVDEDPPLGEGFGPDPSRLLGAAMAHCLTSSFLFCMQKSRANVGEVSAIVRIEFGRNEKKRLRISGIDVTIHAEVSGEDRSKLERCLPLFREFCTVSESVRNGVPIRVEIATDDSTIQSL